LGKLDVNRHLTTSLVDWAIAGAAAAAAALAAANRAKYLREMTMAFPPVCCRGKAITLQASLRCN